MADLFNLDRFDHIVQRHKHAAAEVRCENNALSKIREDSRVHCHRITRANDRRSSRPT